MAWGDRKEATLSTCGRMWVSVDGGATFLPTLHNPSNARAGAGLPGGVQGSWKIVMGAAQRQGWSPDSAVADLQAASRA